MDLKRIRDIIKDLKGFAYDDGTCLKEELMPNDIVQPVKRLLAHDLKEQYNPWRRISITIILFYVIVTRSFSYS